MRHEDLKVGMLVKANEKSNARYCYTNQRKGCKGIVKRINDSDFELEITEHENSLEIGVTYDVKAEYFDIVEESTGMKIELKEEVKELDFTYGDLLVFENGKKVLVMSDSYDDDYRAVVLGVNKVTDYTSSKNGLIRELRENFEVDNLVRVVKAENLKLVEI